VDVAIWTALGVGLVGAGFALGQSIAALRTRRQTRHVEGRKACPKTGADVDLELVENAHTGRVLRVVGCSGSGRPPRCDRDCVWIMNMGVPLPPRAEPCQEEGKQDSR
jgi:hypothetical protein